MADNRPYNRGARRAIVGLLGLLLVGILVPTLALPSTATPQRAPYQSTAYPGGLAEVSNACGPIFRFDIRDDQYGVIPDAVYKRYPDGKLAVPVPQMVVPVYGYLDRSGLTRQQIAYYPQDSDPGYPSWVTLRAMYDYDTTVIWYTAATTLDDQDALADYAKAHDNVLILPWPQTNRPLPNNRVFAFSRWGISQSCQTYDPAVLEHFIAFADAHPVTHPRTAPQAKTRTEGVLPGIAARENRNLNYVG